jgi:hypothetical protein
MHPKSQIQKPNSCPCTSNCKLEEKYKNTIQVIARVLDELRQFGTGILISNLLASNKIRKFIQEIVYCATEAPPSTPIIY